MTTTTGSMQQLADAVNKTRTPRNYESIKKGALDLPLAERVDLRNELKASIEKEVKDLQDQAAKAKEIAGE